VTKFCVHEHLSPFDKIVHSKQLHSILAPSSVAYFALQVDRLLNLGLHKI